MKRSIYELDKTRTPGPLTTALGVLVAGDGTRFPLSDPTRPYTTTQEQDNAVYLAHCANHFMEALAKLEEMQTRVDDLLGKDGEPLNAGLYDLIKKLETVEVPE